VHQAIKRLRQVLPHSLLLVLCELLDGFLG
jgi:hypothetical protein